MQEPICLQYSRDAYNLVGTDEASAVAGPAPNLMGRHVAGAEFLDAYLKFGCWDRLFALVHSDRERDEIQRVCVRHESSQTRQRRMTCVGIEHFRVGAPAEVLHAPCPPDERFAWCRQHQKVPRFALCGLTHTLCSPAAVAAIRSLVLAPFLPFDRLICTSMSGRETVRAIAAEYSRYLRSRFGGEPRNLVPLEILPLGVDTQAFSPPNHEQRRRTRQQFDVRDDEFCVLNVGRLTHHAKANPHSLFRSLSAAASHTGMPIHLIMWGQFPNQPIRDAYENAAKTFAGNIRITFATAKVEKGQFDIWHAADLFMSLADNIQETFGLVIIEAMASGLPVIASDWDGYRDTVVHGETGFLISTSMFRNSAPDLTMRLLTGELSYDRFIAEASQQVSIDIDAATEAVIQLILQTDLRRKMGQAGRNRAVREFDWSKIIQQHEALWQQQIRECRAWSDSGVPSHPTPAKYPPLDYSFAHHPKVWLDEQTMLQAIRDADVGKISEHPIANYALEKLLVGEARISGLLSLAEQPISMADLVRRATPLGMSPRDAKRMIAWAMKYGLLRRADR